MGESPATVLENPLRGVNPSAILPASEDGMHPFWVAFRKSLLDQVDAIERMLGISPTTAELRQMYKRSKNA